MTAPPAVARAAAILQARAGFRPDPALNDRLTRCLGDAAEAAGACVDDFVATLPADDDALQELVDRVTIQESSFFRDDAQFVAFSRHLLPQVSTSALWSAGCANGQEPWSLAMLLDEQGRTDCTILATDISTTALERAERGWYSARELRGLSPTRLARYFTVCDGGYEVNPSLRRLVSFGHHNLAADAPPLTRGACEVAFCRNVLIYLTDDEISAVLERLAQLLGAGGHLFLGYSESLWRLPSRFLLRRLGPTFVYEVEGREQTVAPAVTPPPPTARARRERPVDRVAATPAPPPPAPTPSADDYLAQGQVAAANRELTTAVVAFRKAAYLRPDDPGIALHLAFTLEALDDVDGARPWFRRALETMADAEPMASILDGWSAPELTRVLERKVVAPAVDR